MALRCARLEHIERRSDGGVARGVRLEPLEAAAVVSKTYVIPPFSNRRGQFTLRGEVPIREAALQVLHEHLLRVFAERGGDEERSASVSSHGLGRMRPRSCKRGISHTVHEESRVLVNTPPAHAVAALYDVVLYTAYPRSSSVNLERQFFYFFAHVLGVHRPCIILGLLCVAQDACDTRAFIHARHSIALRPRTEAECTHAVTLLHDVISGLRRAHRERRGGFHEAMSTRGVDLNSPRARPRRFG